MTNNSADGSALGRFFLRIALAVFLILSAIFMAVVCRGGIGFLIDPIPRWVDFALILAWMAIIAGVASVSKLTESFFFDKIACRVMFAFFLFWLAFVTIHADQIAQTHAYLNQNALYLWSPEYTMTFPCSFLLMEDTYTWSLYLEGALLVNPVLSKFVLFCVYWPLIFLVEGVAFWSFLFFVLRALTRLFCRIFCRKADKAPTVFAPKESAPEESGDSLPVSAKQPCSHCTHLSFFTLMALAFLILVAVFWGYFLTTHIRQARVWHQDFVSARIFLSRFYHQNGRLPQTWDEIVESPNPPSRKPGDPMIEPNEHYYLNPGLSRRIELNFEHLAKIDAETANLTDDWIFRVAARSKMNPTGELEPFLWEQWQINLVNIISRDRLMRSLPSEPVMENLAAPVPVNKTL